MKRKNATRSALFTSIISLLLCVSMLVGTTFAWFTDSVVSGNNVIAAGNLDIELYNDGNRVTESTNLFNGILWEPGVVDYENFTIKNEGNLALLYDFAINWSEYNQMTVGGYNLTQILKVAMIDGHVSGDRAAAIAAGDKAGWKALDSWSFKGEMTTKDETKNFALIIYWEPSDDDNNYNVQNGKGTSDGQPLYVNLGINLQATQKMHESDSFGKDYDSLANAWDGVPGELPEADENGVITITTGAELAAFAKAVNEGNKYAGKTIKLGADINLGNQDWTPIGACNSAAYFQGTFDGQGHTIYNLSVDKSNDAYANSTTGLFGWIDAAAATIKNVNLENATVKGSHWVGGLVGYMTGTVENCSVINSSITGVKVNDDANGDKVGGLVGYMNSGAGKLDGNAVQGTTVSGYRDVAGLAGAVATSNTVTNNKVENVTVNFSTDYVGEIVSPKTTVVVDSTNTATNVKIVKSVVVSTADELAAALKSTDKDIVITLANNIDVPISSLGQQTGGSGEYKLAGEATETITLDLNDKKLNITTTYWSNIGAKNDDAVFTIKNGTMTSSQATGTWNSYDVTFSNCNYVIEDVVFEKAIAFANTGKSVKLSNVTVNETHDYYAIWICAEGMDVEIDGLTVNSAGRGIKIDEEYVGSPVKVTLKVSNADFNTVKKGAIMVKSAAGADIALSNVDISGVKADSTNAVWVDEDATAHADKVTVTGGTKINESELTTDNKALDNDIKAGKTTIKLAGGTYIIPDSAQGKTLTIIGLGDTFIATQDDGSYEGCDYSLDGSTVTFENITINTDSATYTGYARLNASYKNCTINGTYTLYGNSTFEDCTFNVSGDVYNIWTWGAPEASFTGCTFNSDGKAMLLYGTENTKLTLDTCVFNDTGILPDLKAAVEIGNDYNKSYELIVNNTVVNGYEINDKGINTGSTLWANKNSMGTDKLNVVIDGVDVY